MLFVGKKDYFNTNSFIHRILSLRPLPTLVGLVSRGEDFHPRVYGKGLKRGESDVDFQKYITEKAEILQNMSGISDYKLLHK